MYVISRRIRRRGVSLSSIIACVTRIITGHTTRNGGFNAILVPRNLVRFVPTVGELVTRLGSFLTTGTSRFTLVGGSRRHRCVVSGLSGRGSRVCTSLPRNITHRLALSHSPRKGMRMSLVRARGLLSSVMTIGLTR